MSIGFLGCSSRGGPHDSGPYQATPAFTAGLCASYIHTMRPPQQKPVMPSLAVSALPSPLAKATVESRSPMTCSSGTLDDDLADQLGNLGVGLGIALAEVEFRRDGVVAGLGEAAAHVGDVGVHAEDLLHHQDGAEALAARRHGAIGVHVLAVLGLDLDRAGGEPVGRRDDHGLRLHRLDGQREGAAEHHAVPPGPRAATGRSPLHKSSDRHPCLCPP